MPPGGAAEPIYKQPSMPSACGAFSLPCSAFAGLSAVPAKAVELLGAPPARASHCCNPAGTVGVVLMKLALFLYCRGSRNPAVRAFALDHLNDVLVNGIGLGGEEPASPPKDKTCKKA